MSSNFTNFALSPGARGTGVRAYNHHTPYNDDLYEVPVFYQSQSGHASPDEWTSNALNSQRFLEDRTHAGLHGRPDFPAEPHRIFILNGDTGRGFNPRLRETHQQSVPTSRSTRQANAQAPTAQENSRSRALSKLKKEIYDPSPSPTPKLLAKRVSLYYRDTNPANALKEMEMKEKGEEGKRCAVCLEDFEPKEEVMVTPCKHMFHEDCIVPWVGSQGQCPICRSVICARASENPSSSSFNFNTYGDIGSVAPSDIIAAQLMSILRAMEEAFELRSETH